VGIISVASVVSLYNCDYYCDTCYIRGGGDHHRGVSYVIIGVVSVISLYNCDYYCDTRVDETIAKVTHTHTYIYIY
jgi:hypothetical protein